MPSNHHTPLFDPFTLGKVQLRNRAVLAPMTRVSANPDGSITDRMSAYYRVFAAGGFGALITEGLYIDTEYSQGYFDQPGIAVDSHVRSWRRAVDAVHEEGSAIIAQLMHAGPQSQGNPFREGARGPSANAARGQQLAMYRGAGPYQTPRPLTVEELRDIRRAFVASALRARDAGFDGVEVHSANGYLLDAFLTDYLNDRTDEYGGSSRNRVRLTAEICSDIREAVGDDLVVGVRVSQGKVSDFDHKWAQGVEEAEIVFTELGATGIDYVHTTEFVAVEPAFEDDPRSLASLARQFSGATVIANGSLNTSADAHRTIEDGHADLVAIGKAALANRNWPQLVAAGAPVKKPFQVPDFGELATLQDWEIDAESLLSLDTKTARAC